MSETVRVSQCYCRSQIGSPTDARSSTLSNLERRARGPQFWKRISLCMLTAPSSERAEIKLCREQEVAGYPVLMR